MSRAAEDGLVLFDLDGTLAATAPDIAHAINLVLLENGLPSLPEGEAEGYVGSGAGAEFLIRRSFLRAGRDLAPAESKPLLARYFAVYLDNICLSSRLYEGCTEALDGLIAAGNRLAVCTNKPTAHSQALLERLGVADRFSAICGRDRFAAHKPDPRHVLGTIAQAGGAGRGAVLVGDSETDLEAARNAGIPLILVRFGYGADAAAQRGVDAEIGHFRELARALEALREPA
jgi:phosphoglycolate phosphatase